MTDRAVSYVARRVAGALALSILVHAGSGLAADRGLQFTPDGKRVLANKDVGNERWAISLDLGDGTVIGNVFRSDGGPPAFVACNPLPADDTYACFGADPCSDGGGADRGIQQTLDGTRTLVSKDVGVDRWAISLNDDGTVTGNVFRSDGGEPAFLACDPLPAPDSFSCFGADACNAPPCEPLFGFIDDVTLPSDFFAVPGTCTESFDFIANVTLPEGFFELQTAEDFVSEVETTGGVPGALRVGAAPIPGPGAPNPVGGVGGDPTANPGGTNDVTVTFGEGAAAATATVRRGDPQFTGLRLVLAIGDQQCAPGDLLSDFYEIPLVTASGQLELSVSFAENLGSGEFVLCLTTIEDDVVGNYFAFQQVADAEPTECGDGIVKGKEECDPPGSQGKCGASEVCGASCLCEPAGGPTIANFVQRLVEVSSPDCDFGHGGYGSLFLGVFSYDDPDGDVTIEESVVDLSFVTNPSGIGGSQPSLPIVGLNGTPFSGTVQFEQCYRFDNESSIDVSVSLRDDAGNPSNVLTENTPRPQGTS